MSTFNQFPLFSSLASTDGCVTAVSRIPTSMEVFWINQNGSVHGAYWYDGTGWGNYELAPAGSASTDGGIAVVSRIPTSMEVFWIGPDGSVQDAYWYEGAGWNRFQLATAGSASTRGSITAVSRMQTSMEVFWIGPGGSVEDAYFYEGAGWNHFQLSGAGSASIDGCITAVSRIPTSMEVFWIGTAGSIQDAYFYDGAGWNQFQLAANGSASTFGSIKAVSRIPTSMEVFWIGADGSVQDAYWYDNAGWNHFQLAPAGMASVTGNITAVSRMQSTMEVFWTGADGSIQDAYWYDTSGWGSYNLFPQANASVKGCIAAVSRIPTSMELWFIESDGTIQDGYWYDDTQQVKWAIVLCQPSDDSSIVQPASFFTDLFKGAGNGSIRDYYSELSNNKIDFSTCDVLGFYTVNYKKSDLTKYNADGTVAGTVFDRGTNIFKACEDVAKNQNIDFRKYTGVVVIYSYKLGDGGAAAVGQTYSMNLNGSTQNYSALLFDSDAWSTLDSSNKVESGDAWSNTFVEHEVGHGLGLQHSRDSANNDYGDWYDIMSAMSCASHNDTRQFMRSGPGLNAPNLITLNVLYPTYMTTYYSYQHQGTNAANDTVYLSPLHPSKSLKVIKILNSDGSFYTVEYRIQTNWDAGIDGSNVILHLVDTSGRNSSLAVCKPGGKVQKDNITVNFTAENNSVATLELSGVYR